MRISVCIATYNGEKYIKQQLESILSQLGPEDEVIISDDSSTDQTISVVKSFGDKRIKIFEGQQFKNPIFNFEHAFSKAKNEYIFISDQDDLWVEGKVKTMMEALGHADMVVSDHSVIDEDGNILIPSYFKVVRSAGGVWHNMKKNTYYGCCMAFKRKVLFKALPFPKDIPMHDIWLGFVADVFFKSTFIDYPYTQYRKHTQNVSTASDFESPASFITKINNRLNYLKYFPLLLSRMNKKDI